MGNNDHLNMPQRPRRLRRTSLLRDAVAENEVRLRHLVQGHFVLPGSGITQPIKAMPGVSRQTADELLKTVGINLDRGIGSVMLFGVPETKDAQASGAIDPEGEVPLAVRALKQEFGKDLLVLADVCLCPYTDHGHCGFIEGEDVVNDRSTLHLARMATVLADAGADFVCPSDMMDGRIGVIREALDTANHQDTAILAYSAKYASAFYGPFREAADSAPTFGDRRSYQMDSRNGREATREMLLDIEEGADMIMVKPAMAYMDIIRAAKEISPVPVVAYNVSGEYSMVKLSVREGLADEQALVTEILGGLRRAGADLIITYHAEDAAREGWIQ